MIYIVYDYTYVYDVDEPDRIEIKYISNNLEVFLDRIETELSLYYDNYFINYHVISIKPEDMNKDISIVIHQSELLTIQQFYNIHRSR